MRNKLLSKAHFSEANLSNADFSGADLSEADLSGANLSGTDFKEANLSGASLRNVSLRDASLKGTNLKGVDLRSADLRGVDLRGKDLSGANLSFAQLSRTDLSKTVLKEANLNGANLNSATLVGTNLARANLTGCSIHGISAWNIQLEGARQSDLIITDTNESTITVENLRVAQFIYLLLANKEIREVIDTITSKVVLILGRFTAERKLVLEALRDKLRDCNDSPILFDFEKPTSRDLTETISTLAHMARFVIADLTDAKSIPQELERIVPELPSVPVQPILRSSDHEYSMFEHLTRYPWVQPIYRYDNVSNLLQSIQEHIIDPAEKKVREAASKLPKT